MTVTVNDTAYTEPLAAFAPDTRTLFQTDLEARWQRDTLEISEPTYSGPQLLADAWIEAVRKAKWGR